MKALHRTREALRADDGMTLVELMVGIGAAMVVIFAAYGAISTSNIMQTRTVGRIDAVERGRTAIDQITRDIRAQMCLPTSSGGVSSSDPAILFAGGDGVMFYASVAPPAKGIGSAPPTNPGGAQPVEMRKIEWIQTGTALSTGDPNAQPVGKIVETVWRSTNTTPPYTFPAMNAPTTVQTIASDVEHTKTGNTVNPIFRYYGYTVVSGVGRPSTTPLPLVASSADAYNTAGVPAVSDANSAAVVMIDIQFNARPYSQRTTEPSSSPSRATPVVAFYNRVSVRTSDPTDPGVSPLCL